MRITGLLLLAIALLLPIYWFTSITGQAHASALFSQYLGVYALVAMGITQLFATRWHGLEMLFGGLDRIYIIHKWLGISALLAVLLHDTIDAEFDGAGRETLLTDLAETLGEMSLYGLLVLVVITITTFIPYHLWKWTHKLMGGFFALSAFHFLFIHKPFANTDPLGLYVSAFCATGVIAYLYTLIPERMIRLRKAYKVTEIRRSGDALSISLSPKGKGISHRAGQFAFIQFDTAQLKETHPFTISCAPNANRDLRFTVKPLGDYTRRLETTLTAGGTAFIQGAFGHFYPGERKGTQIWIAGGIGVTPFLARGHALQSKQPAGSDPIHLFYCVSDEGRAAHLDELCEIENAVPSFHLHVIESRRDGRLDAAKIKTLLGHDFNKVSAAFCGPEAMREALKHDLVSHGLPSGRFAYEEFEIRSGIFHFEKMFHVITKRRLLPR